MTPGGASSAPTYAAVRRRYTLGTITGVPLRAYGLTDKGRVRPTNEDCFAIQEELGLCVVADGMGGHNAGEVAARLAVDAVVDFVRLRSLETPASFGETGPPDAWPFGFDPSLSADGNLLRTAIHLANVQIREAAVASHDYAGMGTTIVAARVSGRPPVGRARRRQPALSRRRTAGCAR